MYIKLDKKTLLLTKMKKNDKFTFPFCRVTRHFLEKKFIISIERKGKKVKTKSCIDHQR